MQCSSQHPQFDPSFKHIHVNIFNKYLQLSQNQQRSTFASTSYVHWSLRLFILFRKSNQPDINRYYETKPGRWDCINDTIGKRIHLDTSCIIPRGNGCFCQVDYSVDCSSALSLILKKKKTNLSNFVSPKSTSQYHQTC